MNRIHFPHRGIETSSGDFFVSFRIAVHKCGGGFKLCHSQCHSFGDYEMDEEGVWSMMTLRTSTHVVKSRVEFDPLDLCESLVYMFSYNPEDVH